MAKIPVVSKVEISKTFFGGVAIKFTCPHCNEPLSCTRSEIGKPDRCPKCSQGFVVSPKAEEQLREREQALEKALSDAQAVKDAEIEEKRYRAALVAEAKDSLARDQRQEVKAARQEVARERELDRQDHAWRSATGNRTYKALSALATAHFAVGIACVILAVGVIALALILEILVWVGILIEPADGSRGFVEFVIGFPFRFLSSVGIALVPAAASMYWFAVSEAIRLAINVAIDVQEIRRQGEVSGTGPS